MKTKKFKYLSDSERSEIEILLNKGYSIRGIAMVLGRSPNTISYEIKRCPSGYKAKLAKQYARTKLKNRRLQWRKINRYSEIKEYIIEKLKEGWNPHEIAGRIRLENDMNVYISATSIYKWLMTDIQAERYKKYLYMFRLYRRRHKKRNKHGQIQHMQSIHTRGDIVVGTWETDLVLSNRLGKGALSTSTERISRYLVVDYVPDQKASSKQKTLNRLEREFFVSSIAFDRGHENARHYECTTKTYFCDAYSSFQRGLNENQNKLLRRYFPKGIDFSRVSHQQIERVVCMINNKPRKVLGFRTAKEVAIELGVIRKVS